jgi:eukaryotic-like serine/threonine-protein kinase
MRERELFEAAVELHDPRERARYLDQACAGDAAIRARVDALLQSHDEAGSFLNERLAVELDSTIEDPSPGDPNARPGRDPSAATAVPSLETTASDRESTEVALPGSVPDAPTIEYSPTPDRDEDTVTLDARSESLAHGATIRYFGDYEIKKRLGRGGMGVVYEALQVSLNRPVALKMIKAGVLADPGELRRFQNEAEAVALLDHAGIVPVYEVGEHEGQRYFSMKLIEGGNLAEHLTSFKANPTAAATLLSETADAVHHAHMRGILHRDLKPANILVDALGRPHVTDFGLAKRVESDVEMTQSGAILGTPAYMSPEQAFGRRGTITTATDVYGLGAILYATLTGKAPFGGDSVIDTLDAVRTLPPVPPRTRNAHVPRDLETICIKCLEKDPRRRYASAHELAVDLRNWLESRPIAARPVGPVARLVLWGRRMPMVAGLAAALALATAVGAAGIVWNWVEVRRQRDLLASANVQISREWSVSRAINDLLINGLLERATPLGRDVTVVELLDGIAGSVATTYRGNPKLEAATRQVIGDAYRVEGKLDRAELHLTRAYSLRESLPGGDELDRLSSRNSLAALRLDQRRRDEAMSLAASALEGRRRLLGPSDPATIASANLVAYVLRELARPDEAESMLLPYYQDAVRTHGTLHRETIRTASNLAELAIQLGRDGEAETRLRELIVTKSALLPADQPHLFNDQNNLGRVLYKQRKFKESATVLKIALDSARRALGADHWATLNIGANLAAALLETGEMDEARRLLKLPEGGQAMPGDVINAKNSLAFTHLKQGRFLEAEALMREVVTWYRNRQESGPRLARYLVNFAGTLAEEAKTVEAEKAASEALEIYRRYPTTRPSEVTNGALILGWMLLENGKADQAETVLKDVVDRRSADPSELPWKVAVARSLLGAALAARGDRVAAEPLILKSYTDLESLKDAPPRRLADALARVVKLYENWPGREAEARAWRVRASR